VAIAVRGLTRGGAERLVFQEAKAVQSAGLPVEVWYQVAGEFGGDLADLGVPTHAVGATNARTHMKRLLDTHPRLVVHTHSPSMGALLRVAATGLPRVRFIHTEHNLTSSYRRVTRAAHRLTSRRIDELVAVSKAVLQSAPNVPRRRVLYHLDLTTERKRTCLERRFKEDGPLRLLCVASLTPKKDHANLLRALERLETDTLAPIWVGIVGEGRTRPEVSELAQRVNERCAGITVELLGARDDIPELLECADVLVLPSKSEGLPLIVMEAMAASTPVVATAVGGVPELVEHDRTGLLVPPQDEVALAEAISRLLGDRELRRCLASRARESVLDLASTPWTDEYLAIFEAE
jgi:glycosyltransferase involved in cell wall biosynthesis